MRKISCFVCVLCMVLSGFSMFKGHARKETHSQMGEIYSDTVNFRLASQEEGRALVAVDDDYIRDRSLFDIASRLGNPDGTKEELKALSIREVQEWNADETQQIRQIMTAINDTIRKHGYRLPLPKEIVLVKSSMKDEGGAGGYTRSNWIALTGRLFTDAPEEFRKMLLVHETFHVLTRNSPEFKKQMYETIGFTITPEELEYPADLKDRKISNPDVGRYDSYGTFTIDGQPRNCTMVLYSNRPYTTGGFFEYMNVGFVPLDENLKAIQSGDTTLVYPMDKVSDFYDKVGKNTQYIIHPEEIMAENFVIALLDKQDISTPELKEKVQQILKQQSK